MRRLLGGSTLLVLLAVLTIFGPAWLPHDPLEPSYAARYAAPSLKHWLGTDGLGRDVFARSLAGGRVSLSVTILATLGAVFLGATLGVIGVGFSSALDVALTRIFDAVLAFPGFLLVLILVAILGGGVPQTVLALSVAGSPLYFRLARAYTRSTLKADYVLAGVALGATRWRLLSRHVTPNFMGPLSVQVASTAATFLLVEASLSYLGLGVPLPTPSWGNVLQDARALLLRQPWAALGPGVFLTLAVLSFQLMADGLRDVRDKR